MENLKEIRWKQRFENFANSNVISKNCMIPALSSSVTIGLWEYFFNNLYDLSKFSNRINR